MRAHDMLRLLIGLVFVATLPTGSAQPKGGACNTDSNCGIGSCCKADQTCSLAVRGTIVAGKSAEDPCECVSQVLDSGTWLCGCGDDSHCAGTRCCTANGTCSKKEVGTILPGRTAYDACECSSGGIVESTGRCRCIDANIDCEPNKCCKADDICSTRDRASVVAGYGASDPCECASGNMNKHTGKCECADDSQCPDTRCCTADGSCSKRDIGTVLAGKVPDDACECGSGVIIRSTGKCRCTDDAHCEGNKCCGDNGICSRRDGASVLVGRQATDACECAEGRYDPVTKRCGCTSDTHCAGNACCKADSTCSTVDGGSILAGEGPAEDACACVTGQYDEKNRICVCTKNSDCAGDTCCKADQTCSKKDLGSVKPGGAASDACECSSLTYSADTGKCQCRGDGDCAGDKCCGINNVCSVEDEASVPPGIAATDECECVRKGGYTPGPTSDTGVCGCTDASHCPEKKCCMADGACSQKDVASVDLGGKASDACECTSGAFFADTGRCVCGDDSFCKGDLCCRKDGRCSSRDKASVPPGFIGNDACECASGVHIPGVVPSKDRCGCKGDSDCKSANCCMEDGRCSARKKESVSAGVVADDKCECLSLTYDPSRGVCGCTENDHCAADAGEICSKTTRICELDVKASAVGDPHMTGFSGQKFDFTGEDGAWYALISDPPSLQLNMRVTVPFPSLPEITYITGFALLTTDDVGFHHSIVVTTNEPHNLETACPVGVSPCLANGSLTVLLDGEEALVAPGTVSLAPGIDITVVNTPGECRPFGFARHWEKKKQDNAALGASMEQENAQERRMLSTRLSMGEWILADPTVTNMADCTDYVAHSAVVDGGLFAHQSEHSSFRIATPAANIRLSHGKEYEFIMRDSTIDLPNHVTWQMNIAIDDIDAGLDAKGILGETVVPTRDASGNRIMHGVECIRGVQADYAVEGPLGTAFPMDSRGTGLRD